ncbi:holin-like protein [Vibrio crassostreae]|nr:holin-like protein [Vibrio crassostreae]
MNFIFYILSVLQSLLWLTFPLLIGKALQNIFSLPISGSIIGLLILFIGLQSRLIKPEKIEKGASLMIANLTLFFLPVSVGIIDNAPYVYENIHIILTNSMVISIFIFVFASKAIEKIDNNGL